VIIELREQLVHTNVSFATEISDMQEGISANLTKFVDIVAKINKLDFVPSEYIQIALIPPIVLMVQLIEMTLSSIGNMFSAFQAMQIPADPYFLLENIFHILIGNHLKKEQNNIIQILIPKMILKQGNKMLVEWYNNDNNVEKEIVS